MDCTQGIHFILDCKINKNFSFLINYEEGIDLINKIVKEVELNILTPVILIDFPQYDKDIKITPFENQVFENKIKFIQPNCFINTDKNKKNNSGYSLFGIISESHISIHTFPEENYFSFDLYSCKNFDTNYLEEIFKKYFNLKSLNSYIVKRGSDKKKWFYEDLFVQE